MKLMIILSNNYYKQFVIVKKYRYACNFYRDEI
jgi:hypothetical protein